MGERREFREEVMDKVMEGWKAVEQWKDNGEVGHKEDLG